MYIRLHLFLFLVYLPLFLYTSLSIQIDAYLFLSLCQSKFTTISFKSVFFISVYFSYIRLYLFLSLVYSPLSLSISLLIQIHAYLFQSRFLYLCLFFIYPPVSIFISFLSTTIFFYPFANLNSRLYLSMFFSLFQYIPHLFTSITFYLLYISLPIQVHVYLFSSLSILVVISSNLVHTASLITNNYIYLMNRNEMENDTAKIQGIDRNRSNSHG